jgi:hypothetical protein
LAIVSRKKPEVLEPLVWARGRAAVSIGRPHRGAAPAGCARVEQRDGEQHR